MAPDHSMPSPERVFQALNGYHLSEALKAAINLKVFTAIDNGQHTAEAIASQTNSHPRGLRILCDFLTVVGFLSKEEGEYGLTAESAAFLSENSKTYIGDMAGFLVAGQIKKNFDDLTGAVKKGGTVANHSGLEPNHEMWVDFARSMAGAMMLPAHSMAGALGTVSGKVLDIAAGHGVYGIAVAQQNPAARIVGLDWPNVLNVAKDNAARMGVHDRYSTLEGSAFDVDFGTGYELILLPNFLHHFDAGTNTELLSKCFAALAKGGRVAVVEFVPNPDRVTPPAAATFALIMLAGTPAGDAYTEDELRKMLQGAGFRDISRQGLPPSPNTLIVGVK